MSCGCFAEIDLSALKENLIEIKRLAGPAKICLVVKDDAYGHGAAAVAANTQDAADMFAVACTEEGAALRLAGITKPVLVLLPSQTDISRALRYRLTLAVDSLGYAREIDDVAASFKTRAEIHIKVNTGMNRFGFAVDDIPAAAGEIAKLKNVRATGLFSHFFDASDKACRERQFSLFLKARESARQRLGKLLCHISASGGILAGRKYGLDAVRPGLLLYGYKPYPCEEGNFRPVMKVKARVLESRSVEGGEHLLYGQYVLPEKKEISIVASGYGCGLSSRTAALNDRCMDVSAVENTEEEWITVMADAEKEAAACGRKTYEVLTGLKNLPKIYRD